MLNTVTELTSIPRRMEAFSKLNPDVLGAIVVAGRLTPLAIGHLLRALLPSDMSQVENPIYWHLICKLRDLISGLVQRNGFTALSHLPPECFTQRMYVAALSQSQNVLFIRLIPLKQCIEGLWDVALHRDGDSLQCIPADYREAHHYLLASKTAEYLDTFYAIPKEFRTMEICLNYIRIVNDRFFPMCCIYVDTQHIEIINGGSFCNMCYLDKVISKITNISNCATYCPDAFWVIPGIAEVVAKICGLYIAFIPARLLTHTVLELAVKQNGKALGLIDPERITQAMCRAAVADGGAAILKLIPRRFDTPELRELIYEITDVLIDDGEIDRPDTCNYMNWHTMHNYDYICLLD